MLERIAASISIGWKKRQKQMTAIFLAAILMLTGLFLAPSTSAGAISDSTSAQVTTAQTLPTEENSPIASIPSAVLTQFSATGGNCNDQLGALGWIVCPATGALAKAIDFIYDLLGDLLKVNPLTSDNTSPVYIVWEYSRSITNVVFVIFLIVIIISQITGFGLNNYGIKKALPRIIIAAILVNLSYIICALAVDVSNILGFSLRGLFTNVQEAISANANLSGSSMRWDDFVATILAGGAIGGAAIGLSGGIAAFIWMLVPAALGAIVALITGLLTLAARQALVTILIMISPLAFVAYLLPNTESWFKKWKDILISMLVFFPMYSVLFGASQLAGFAIIASANGNVALVILGMAVQIFPLIFSFSLMKMSNTVLGKFSNLISSGLTSATKPIGDYAGDMRDYHKERQRAIGTSTSASLRRYLSDRQIRRKEDMQTYSSINSKRGQAFSKTSIYNRNGKLTKRGQRLYGLIGDDLTYDRQIASVENDFEKGLDAQKVSKSSNQADQLDAINNRIMTASDLSKAEIERGKAIERENAVSFAQRIKASQAEIDKYTDAHTGQIKTQNLQNALSHQLIDMMGQGADSNHQRKERLSNIFATAQHEKNRADKELFDKYDTLFAETEYTDLIDQAYKATFETKDYNLASAALKNLFLRGDVNLIEDDLMEYSERLTAEGNLPMQKALNDLLVQHKADNARLSQYGKANNIRRAKNYEWTKRFETYLSTRATYDKGGFDNEEQANDQFIADNATYEEYFGEEPIVRTLKFGDKEYTFTEKTEEIASDLSMYNLVSTINDPYIATTQDRNFYKWAYKRAIKKGIATYDPSAMSGFNKAQFIRGMCSGRMDGEQLENMTMLLTGGFSSTRTKLYDATNPNDRNTLSEQESQYFLAHTDQITDYLTSQLQSMTGNDLSGMKTVPFFAYDRALMAANPASIITGPDGQQHSKLFIDSLQQAANSIRKNTNLRGATKPVVRAVFGIPD